LSFAAQRVAAGVFRGSSVRAPNTRRRWPGIRHGSFCKVGCGLAATPAHASLARGIVESLGTVRSVLSVLGACWFGACSFPDYRVAPASDPLATVCSDGRPSGAETGLDCGGGCPPCGMGEPCDKHSDCVSGACNDGTCQMPTCTDGVKNATEADVDCSGPCAPCPPGRDCEEDADCAEGVCSASGSACEGDACPKPFCQLATCTDKVHNGTETGVDCGSNCGVCDNGRGCLRDADCRSGHCIEELCVAPGCTDELLNGTESDLDCGGAECKPCAAGAACDENDDCSSRVCEDASCAKDGCDDGVKNRDEPDVDCGGSDCVGCAELGRCVNGTDCQSGVCLTGYCVPATPTAIALSREGWHASASESYPDHTPDQVLDSTGGRWTTGTYQHAGTWFEVDMGQLRTFFAIELTCTEAPDDAPREFRIFLGTEKGKYGNPAGPNKFGGPISLYTFDTARLARFIKIELVQSKEKWWSINEINVLK
jgi:hypothetical protein